MTDRKQFEAMLDALLSENQDAAKEIFHNIVVAKSREIYEELLAEDFDISEESDDDDDKEDEEEMDEAFGDDEAESDDDAGDDEVGGDATDDFIDDTDSESDFGSDEEGEEEGDIEDRVLDLEDALEELKAEFDELMAGEEEEPEHADMFGSEEPEMGDEFGPEEPEMGGEFGSEEEPMDEFSMFMEYVNKVALPKHGDDGANTKSIIAKKNDMGGTTANIAKSFSTEKGGTQGGLLNPSTKEENFGNINVPGANAGKSAFKKKEPGHGAEKKGAGEDAANKKSIIGSSK